jgi:hypothetical protein
MGNISAAEDVADAVTKALNQNGAEGLSGESQFGMYPFWIGVGFAVVLLVFFMAAYFKAGDMTRGQWQILRFFGAFCAGSAGVFLAGGALVHATGKLGTMNYAISGTAGFALFFVVWFTWPKFESPPAR